MFSVECLIIIDYEMKLEPVYYENTLDYFGKYSISSHGTIIWCLYLETCKQMINHCDRMSNGDAKKDCATVIFIIEVFMTQLNDYLLHDTMTKIQSDSATCY